MAHIDLAHSVSQIRRRLFLILMEAFGAVVLLTLVLLLGAVTIFVNSDAAGFAVNLGLVQPLQAYYAGRGGWDGVEAVLADDPRDPPNAFRDWEHTLLLDAAGRVIVDRGRTDTPLVGLAYISGESDRPMPLTLNNRVIGTLVEQRSVMPVFPGVLRGVVAPVLVIAVSSGALTLLIGFLLARRMVTPLADVIGAAHQVASGDLTTRVQVRGPGDLRSLSDSFNRMADALERSDQERRNLLADVAHELRTPLTVIRGRLEGIVDGIYAADETQVAPVLEETYVLERLVEDLRVLTLAESRQLQFDRQSLQLGDLAEHAAGLFQAQAEAKQVSLSVAVDPGTPAVQADPQRVGQVIGNLVSNAIRYTPDGGHVQIMVGPQAGRARLTVRDDGPGVSEADLPKLFDRFWRGEKSRTRAAGGAGLGLAIARQLIEAQGGQIQSANVAGGGLEVSFVL